MRSESFIPHSQTGVLTSPYLNPGHISVSSTEKRVELLGPAHTLTHCLLWSVSLASCALTLPARDNRRTAQERPQCQIEIGNTKDKDAISDQNCASGTRQGRGVLRELWGKRDTLMWTHQEGIEGAESWSRPPKTQDTVAITPNLCQLLPPPPGSKPLVDKERPTFD